MSRLIVNAKLALPGLMLLSKDVYNDTLNNEHLLIKLLPDVFKAFARFDCSADGIKVLVEQLFSDCIEEDTITSSQKDIRKFISLLKTDSEANIALLDMYKHCVNTLAGTETHYNALHDKVSLLKNNELSEAFIIKVETFLQKEYLQSIAHLSTEQITKLREDKDPEYKKVLEAKKQAKNVVNSFLKLLVRQNKGRVLYSVFLAELAKRKLQHSYAVGFEGYINEFNQLLTTENKTLAITPMNGVITMNKNYDAKLDNSYVCSFISPEAKNSTQIYTTDYKKQATNNKFAVVKKLSSSIDKLRASWLLKIKNNVQREEAIVLELIYQTQARIGDTSNATLDKRTKEYRRTYGMSTILGTHITIENDVVTFKYPGKAAYKGDVIHYQVHTFSPSCDEHKIVLKHLKSKVNKKEPVFSCTAAKIRKLLVDINAPAGTTVHKLRTLKGTMMMQEKVKSHPFVSGSYPVAKVTAWLKEQALQVGIALGHMSGEKYTASTAIAHYIDPATMLKLYKDANTVPPKPMLKLVGVDINSLDNVT